MSRDENIKNLLEEMNKVTLNHFHKVQMEFRYIVDYSYEEGQTIEGTYIVIEDEKCQIKSLAPLKKGKI